MSSTLFCLASDKQTNKQTDSDDFLQLPPLTLNADEALKALIPLRPLLPPGPDLQPSPSTSSDISLLLLPVEFVVPVLPSQFVSQRPICKSLLGLMFAHVIDSCLRWYIIRLDIISPLMHIGLCLSKQSCLIALCARSRLRVPSPSLLLLETEWRKVCLV